MVHWSKEPMNLLWSRIHRFLCWAWSIIDHLDHLAIKPFMFSWDFFKDVFLWSEGSNELLLLCSIRAQNLFSIFISHVIKTKIRNRSKNKFATSPRIRSLLFFHSRAFRRSVSNKLIELCMETPCLCPSEGHKHGGGNVTKTSVQKEEPCRAKTLSNVKFLQDLLFDTTKTSEGKVVWLLPRGGRTLPHPLRITLRDRWNSDYFVADYKSVY